jgi:hypothetical protein
MTELLTLRGLVTCISASEYDTKNTAKVTIKHELGSSALVVPIEQANAFLLGYMVVLTISQG